MKATVEQLKSISRKLRASPESEDSLIMLELVRTELARRTSAGRKKVDKGLKERNRIASQKYRDNLKHRERVRKHLEEKRIEQHDKEVRKQGLIITRKKRGTKNPQRWQSVPKVGADGLHY